MFITDMQVRFFIVLVLIERYLKLNTAQYLLDAFIQTALHTKEEVYEIRFLGFRNSSQIPDDTHFVKFQDDIILYDVDDFRNIWNFMTTIDDSLVDKSPDAVDD